MILQGLAFVVVVAVAAYIATVAGAFVFWDLAGVSGPDYTPLVFVLFLLAPAIAVLTGAVVVRRVRPTAPPAQAARPDDERRGPGHGAAGKAQPARRNGPVQYAIAIGGALLVGAVLLALDRTPLFPYVPRIPSAAFH